MSANAQFMWLMMACAPDFTVPAAADDPGGYSLFYQFDRNSPAYYGDDQSMHEYAEDTPIWHTVVACTVSDGEYRWHEAPNGADIDPHCRNSSYMFGYGDDCDVYRSVDGENWESIGTHEATRLFALSDDALLRVWVTSEDRVTVARGTDDGQVATWQRAQWADSGEDFAWLTPGAFLHPTGWGFHQAENGTIVMVEYKRLPSGRYIYRSDDGGVSWSVVHDNGGGNVKHYHAVTKHEGLGRWVAALGDGITAERLVVSDDDGRSWYDYTDAGAQRLQPIYLLDYGHPTRLLFGSDTNWQVGWVDVSDGADAQNIVSPVTNWNHACARNYCWYLFEHAGVYYACNWDFQACPRNTVISVSRDLQHWGVYHRNFVANETGAFGFAGEAGGRLHLRVHTPAPSDKHLVLSPAGVSVWEGLVLAPATTNLFDSVTTSSAESTEGWINRSEEVPPGSGQQGLLECVNYTAHHGDSCLHYVRSDGGYMELASPPIFFETGKTYQGRFWVKGRGHTVQIIWLWNDEAVGFPSLRVGLMRDRWREMITRPFTVLPGVQDLRLLINVTSTSDNSCEMYIDSLQVEEAPSTHWHLGGTRRAPTHAWAVVSAGGAWTNVFTIEPDSISEYLTQAGELHLKTYELAPDTYAELFFDPDDDQFKLQPTVDGVTYGAIAASPQHFQRRAHVRLAVRCDEDKLSLAISNGRPVESVTTAYGGGLGSGDLIIRCYADQRKLLPCTLFNDVMFDVYLSDEQLLSAMNRLTPPCSGDLDGDNDFNLSDLAKLLGHYGITSGASYEQGDLDSDGDVDLADLGELLSHYGDTCD